MRRLPARCGSASTGIWPRQCPAAIRTRRTAISCCPPTGGFAAAITTSCWPRPCAGCGRARGKVAETFFQSKGLPIHRAFRVPDVPGYADVQALCTELLEAYRSGEISSVRLVYQHFQNVLTQLPRVETLLPFAAGEDVGTKSAEASHHGAAEGSPAADTVLCLPDRRTVVRAAGLTCFQSGVYAAVLEAAAGAQAATMMAMRSAYDNAEETSARLELELNRRRQSEVTAGVIETSSDFEQ